MPYIGMNMSTSAQRPLIIGGPLISTTIHKIDHWRTYAMRSINFGFGGKEVSFTE